METIMYSKMQLCGLLNIILLAIFYFSSQHLPLYKRQLFSLVLVLFIVDIVLDIASVAAICNRDVLPPWLVEFICRIYLVSIVVGVWSAIIYVSADLFTEQKHRRLALGLSILKLLVVAAIMLLPIYIFHEQGMLYTYGSSVDTVYLSTGIDIALILLCTCSKKINPRRSFGVRAWMAFWLIAMFVQNQNNEMLMVGFAGSLGMIVLFVSLENPELQRDHQYGCFNNIAFYEYINQCLERGKPFVVCDLALENASLLKKNEVSPEILKRKALALLGHHHDMIVFNNLDMNIYAVTSDMATLRSGLQEYRELFGEFAHGRLETMFYILPDGMKTRSAEDMVRLFGYAKRHKITSGAEGAVLILEQDISDFHHEEEMRQEISLALEHNRVEVFLQPIYSMARQKFTAAEALVRIRREDGSLIPPGKFIAVAEATGQIIELGQQVLEQTARLLAEGRVRELGVEYIEVNLSVVQCENPQLAKEIVELIDAYQLQPEWLNLEITETASINAQKMILRNMQQLQAHGLSFSLDDFGKGESNLMYVVDMPFQYLKLDMDMTKAYQSNPKAQSVVQAVVQMAHGMGLKLIAEGIETAEELHSMEALGIDYIQGYYFSKPLPVEEYLEFLQGQAND